MSNINIYSLITAAIAVIGLLAYYRKSIVAVLKGQKDPQMSIFDFLKVVEKVAPVVLSVVPGVPTALVPFIVSGIQTAEQVQGAKGDQKLAIALNEVNNGIAAINTITPGTIDGSAVNAAITSGINAVVSTVNAVKSTGNVPAPPAKA